jgi:glycosyltransferase involved in cell wall biosynthesis
VATFHSVLGPVRHIWRATDGVLGWSAWAAVLAGVSSTVAREMREVLPGRTVEVLPNGIHPESWQVERIPGPPDELRLVTVMRLQRRKRGEALLRTVAGADRRLESQGIRIRLTVIGDGPRRAALRQLARDLGLEDRVHFRGYLPPSGVKKHFARADAFVLLSIHESFGRSALEARAAGLPVVARTDSAVGEILDGAREALLGRSDEEVLEHLVDAGRDPAVLSRIRHHVAHTPTPYAWPEVTERHLDRYRFAVERTDGLRGTSAGARDRSKASR